MTTMIAAPFAPARRGRYATALALLRRQPLVSSRELGGLLDTNATQVRRDLSALGRLGKRGTGYRVDRLLDELRLDAHVMVTGAGPIAARLNGQRDVLADAGVRLVPLHESADHADAVVIDEPDPGRGLELASTFAALGVPLIVNLGDYLLDAPPARVVNASPLLTVAAAVAAGPG